MIQHKPQVTCQERLEAELTHLQTASGLGGNLKVIWVPCSSNTLSGEVKETVIYIYDKDEGRALETLWHEFLDYYISKTIEPYKEVTNKLIALINEEAYKTKERVIEAITKLSKAPAKRRSHAIDSTEAE